MADDAANKVRKAGDGIREVIAKMERRDSPLARHPLVQFAKEIANMGDILLDENAAKAKPKETRRP